MSEFAYFLVGGILFVVFFYFVKKNKPKDIVLPQPTVLRTDLLYGYYGCMNDQVDKTKDHVNLLWECQFQGYVKTAENILAAKLPTVLDVAPQIMRQFADSGKNFELHPDAEQNLRGLFLYLQSRDALRYVVGLVPVDEPNTNAKSEQDLNAAIDIAISVSKEFPELHDVKMVVIYAAKPYPYVSIERFDWVGVDDYEVLSEIFVNGTYDNIKRSGKRTIILPGGGFGQDPEQFIRFAHLNPEVIAVVPFVYFTGENPKDTWIGIGDDRNPLREAYRAAGKALMGVK